MRYSLSMLLVVALTLGGCNEASQLAPDPAETVAATDDAPWEKQYPAKMLGVDLCSLLRASSGAYLVHVVGAQPHSDPGGVFKTWTRAADGSTTLVTAKVESTLFGPVAQTLIILLPGRAEPVPGKTFPPSSMFPDVGVGSDAIVFVRPHPTNASWWLMAYHAEGFFPISKGGNTSNGVLAVHPVKLATQLIGEIASTASGLDTCAAPKKPDAPAADASPDAAAGPDANP